MSGAELAIRHDEPRRRFEAELDGHPLYIEYERPEPGLFVLTHTIVDPALRGRGLAARLVEHVLAWLAPRELRLDAQCSYAARHLQRHPAWLRLTAPPAAQRVLNFWFDRPGGAEDGAVRGAWFSKNPAFDAEIRARFGALLEQALQGGLRDWDAIGVHGALARILLLDQFTRNSFRDQARAFAGDALAREAALALIDAGLDAQLTPLQRVFAYLPLEHAEDLALQRRSVALFEALAAAAPELTAIADYAQRHLVVIEQFGRFPHRNAALGRPSSVAERDYLARPGAGF